MKKLHIFLVLILCFFACAIQAQVRDSTIGTIKDIPGKYYAKVDKKITSVNDQLTKKSLKYLAKFQAEERKLQDKLKEVDSQVIFTDAQETYHQLIEHIKNKSSYSAKVGGEYNAYMDSLGTSLSFLKQVNGISDKVKSPLKSFDKLQDNLQQSEKIKTFIAERKNQLREILSKYTHLPNGLKNDYAKLNKTAYYYSQQVKEYKAMLKDPTKVEQKVLGILSEVPSFQQFWQKNSIWTRLFPVPDNAGTTQALYGLQTREQLKKDLKQKFGVSIINPLGKGGNAGSGYLQQQMQQTQKQLLAIKDNLSKYGGCSSLTMPNFQPNSQHTKTFLKRLQYGTSIQNITGNRFLPALSTIGLTVGYKLSDKASVGIGVNYLLGLGHGLGHIQFSNQGIGAKSFIDIKLKGSFWISGGIECNYLQQFSGIEAIKNLDTWQKSALLGITKKYKVGKKEHNIQFLYDFMAKYEIPAAQPIKFRTGFSL